MPDILDIPSLEDTSPKTVELSPEVMLERDIRRYVKKDGGFRAGLPEDQQKIGLELLEKAGRSVDDGWDMGIDVPGFTDITAAAPKLKPDALLQQTVVSLQKTVDEQGTQMTTLMAVNKALMSRLDSGSAEKSLQECTASELRDIAETAGIELGNAFIKKEDLIELIEASK